MKSLEEAIEIRDSLIKTGLEYGLGSKEAKAARKDLAFIRPLIIYLESSPTESNIKAQLDLSIKKLARLEEEFLSKHDFKTLPTVKARWMKSKGAAELKSQIKRCRWLLE